MTFCVGLRTKDSVVAVSDSRLTSGDVDFVISCRKVFTFETKTPTMFLMLSGLKSVSDMVITYLNERKEHLYKCDKLFQGVDLLAKIIREVRMREESWIEQGNTDFDISYIVGGQFPADSTAQLFRVYPDASWKRVAKDSPFELIGEGKYGKYIMEYAADFNNSSERSLLLALLAYDATEKSYPLCSPPLDVVIYEADKFKLKRKKLTAKQLQKISVLWTGELNKSIDKTLRQLTKSLLS